MITVTGPESSGKTTIARFLAEACNMCYATEYARQFLNRTNGDYKQEDLVHIAEGQLGIISELKPRCVNGLVIDTGPIVLRVWSQWKYGQVSVELEDVLSQFKTDLFILCKPDIPWEYDPLRESKSDRDALYSLYEEYVLATGVPHLVAESSGEGRQISVLEQLRFIYF